MNIHMFGMFVQKKQLSGQRLPGTSYRRTCILYLAKRAANGTQLISVNARTIFPNPYCAVRKTCPRHFLRANLPVGYAKIGQKSAMYRSPAVSAHSSGAVGRHAAKL